VGAETTRLDWLRGLAATYTEHGSITSEKAGNRSKSGLEATYTEHGSITSETPKNRSKSRA